MRWPYELVGAGYGLLGFALIVAAYGRVRRVEAALARDEFEPVDDRLVLALTLGDGILEAVTVGLVLFAG